MKKLLFSAYDMNIGGIETALLTLLNYLATKGYDITLVLEKKQGTFLQQLDSKIKIIEYAPSNNKIVPIRKIINVIKRIKFIITYKNKFDFAGSFATYSKVASFVARTASSNNALWGHADYLALFKNNKQAMKNFFELLHYSEFKNIIFVSKKARQTFIQVFPNMKDNVIYCNNLINYEKIQTLANEKINLKNDDNVYTFVNVSRHDEHQKRITRIIEAGKKLKKENIKFKILLVGEGQDTELYKSKVKKYNLEKEIEFLGEKQNPYPYMKKANAVLLTSDYEGYPVIFLEAKILNKPIITTDISDAQTDIQNKFGKVIKKDTNSLYNAMKDFIENDYEIKEKFDAKKYNEEIIEKLEKIF